MLNPVDFGSIAVAAIAAGGAWASQRSAAKASTFNTTVTTRLDAEKEAYERARAFDIETIKQQQAQIESLRKENEREKLEQERELESLRKENARLHGMVEDLQEDNTRVHEELRLLRLRVNKLERGFPRSIEEMLRERLKEEPSSGEEQRDV